MIDFVDEFCAACLDWLQRTGLSENYVTGPLMGYSGGFGKYEPLVSTAAEPLGAFTVEQLRDWYHRLTTDTGMQDVFLILASVKALDAIFESMVEDYGGEMRRNREERDYWQAFLDEPGTDPDPDRDEALRSVIAGLDRNSVGALDDLKVRREALVAWREIMTPLIGRTRFRAA